MKYPEKKYDIGRRPKLFYFWLLSLIINANLISQPEYKCLYWNADNMLLSWLNRQVYYQYQDREKELSSAVKSKYSFNVYKQNLKKKFKKLLGNIPDKIDLRARITGVIQKKDYRIEKVIYQSYSNHHITSNLYVPEKKGKNPGVLLFCGHEATAKSTESYQKTAVLFAKNGFVVLVIDPVSQGERYQLTGNDGKPLTRGGTTEHTLLNSGSILLGTSIAAYELYDNLCSLEYLISRPEVDAEKIGCIGNSGGGTQVLYFSAFDERIKAAAPCCWITRRSRTIEQTGMPDGCAYLLPEGKAEMEMSDFLILYAPKPLLILASKNDFIDYIGTEETSREMEDVYNLYGKTANYKMFATDDGHGISRLKREAAVSWFKKWLMGKDEPVLEGEIEIESDSALFCTTTGQVNSGFKNEAGIQDLNLKLFDEYKLERDRFFSKNDVNAQREIVKKLLGINNISDKIEIESLEKIRKERFTVGKYILHRTNEPPLPCILVTPVSGIIKNVIVVLSDTIKTEILNNQEYLDLLEKGNALVTADLRGFGETLQKPDPNEKKFFNKEYRLAATSLHIRRPLLGQRVADIFTIADFIASSDILKSKPIHVISIGMTIPAAIHSVFLDDRISALRISSRLYSWKYYLNNLLERDVYSSVVPNALRFYDLDDLLEIIKKSARIRDS